jgi:ribulose-5-phosphate 4-epimerase/fuculose-1-phosphate aldolase
MDTKTEGAASGGKTDTSERETRVELAAAFRVAHHLGWNDGVNNHISARLPGAPELLLINPRTHGWHEVRASDLVKAHVEGTVLDADPLSVGPAGLNFHSALLRAKPHVNCVLHVHAAPGVVVSALEEGLMILDQTGCMLHGQVAYHEFEGYADEEDEGGRILEELGDKLTMIMWNHGLLSVGRTIGEAFAYMRKLIWACELQERVMAINGKIRPVPEEALDFIQTQIEKRHGQKPYGGNEWSMYLRMAEQLDPRFAT